MKLIEKHYHTELKASEYDFLEVIMGDDKRIKIKFLDERWRTISETVLMLQEVISHVKSLE